MIAAVASTRAPIAELHNRFAHVIPAVQAEGNSAFRSIRSEDDREDALADATLTAWRRFLHAITERTTIDPADHARRAVRKELAGALIERDDEIDLVLSPPSLPRNTSCSLARPAAPSRSCSTRSSPGLAARSSPCC